MIGQRLAFRLALSGAGLLCGTLTIAAADWPQWRGPARTGISAEAGLLRQWPAGGPRLVWRIDNVGGGFSTPTVAGGRVYLVVNEGLANESVRAFSAADGKVLWSTRLGKVGNPDQSPSYPAARSSATVDGDTVYALSSDGDLAALDVATGAARWKKQLRSDFGGVPGTWAYAESPFVDGDRVVVTPGGKTTMVALNKRTGAPILASLRSVQRAGGLRHHVHPAGGRLEAVRHVSRQRHRRGGRGHGRGALAGRPQRRRQRRQRAHARRQRERRLPRHSPDGRRSRARVGQQGEGRDRAALLREAPAGHDRRHRPPQRDAVRLEHRCR